MSLLELECRRRVCITLPHVTGCALISVTPIRANTSTASSCARRKSYSIIILAKDRFVVLVCSLIGAATDEAVFGV